MTIFGIDISNNNGSGIDMNQVRAEGFDFVFCKVSEGDSFTDWTWPGYRDAARAAGLLTLGYHYVIAGDDPDAQAGRFADNGGGNVAMLDHEANSGGIGEFWSVVNAFNRRGIEVVRSYIPRWYWAGAMGGGDLSRVPGLIASSYVSAWGYASAIYPGDGAAGWAPYGGGTPDILQFSDRGLVAGNWVDINAFRGTRDQLAALLTGQGDDDMQLSDKLTDAYGNQVSVEDALKWLLYHTDLTVDQIGGAGTRNDMPAQFGGWPQLNNRTVVDALAEIGAHLGMAGYGAPAAPSATPGGAS